MVLSTTKFLYVLYGKELFLTNPNSLLLRGKVILFCLAVVSVTTQNGDSKGFS